MLSVDVYVKKKCIEHLIDDMHSVQEQTLKKNEQKIKNTEKAKAAEKAATAGKTKANDTSVSFKSTNKKIK